tara:strand:+ start:202 stop:375 length:174 start_codon:yes stop_codon:yes gene_type:complete
MTLENKENIVMVKERTVYCAGSDDKISDGHPKVWLKIPNNKTSIQCPYCEKKFILSS